MSDVQKVRNLIREEIKKIIGEQDGLDKLDVKLPAQAQRFLNKAVSAIKGANLNRRKQVAALAKIVDALGLDRKELARYITKIKREL